MLRDDYEVELVGFRAGDQFSKGPSAGAAERGVNMNHAFVVDVTSIVESCRALRRELLNRVAKSAQTIASIRKWNLRKDGDCDDGDEDASFHKPECRHPGLLL